MKKFPIVLAAVTLVAAGCFAAASIASGGSFADMLTGTTATTTVTATTTATHTDTNENDGGQSGGQTSGRRVQVCHKTGPKKSPKFHTITVDQHALKGLLKHGDKVGACSSSTTTTTTTTSASTTTSQSGDDHGKGSEHGNGGSDHGNNGNNGKGHGKP